MTEAPPRPPPLAQQPPRRRRPALVVEAVVIAVVVLVAVVVTRALSTGGTSSAPAAPPTSVTADVEPGVVDIVSTLGYQSARSAGTGMVLSASGEVLTNNHVINGATSVEVTDIGDGRTYRAVVAGTDASHDVAVLHLQGASGLARVPFGDSSSVAVGDAVVAIGNAGGAGGAPRTASGRVTALDQTIVASDSQGLSEQLAGMIQTDAAIQPGYSGGPLVDADGRVIGINTAASNGYTVEGGAGEGYAIPTNTALGIARQIEAGEASETIHIGPAAFLGVGVQDAPGGAGAQVVGVIDGSPAEQAGLVAGDTITALDDRTVPSASSLVDALRAFHPGDTIRITWLDTSGQRHSTGVQLVTGPAN